MAVSNTRDLRSRGTVVPLPTTAKPRTVDSTGCAPDSLAESADQVAERKGFEPLRRLPAYTLSRRAPSTTRPSLRIGAGAGSASDSRAHAALRREAAEHPSKARAIYSSAN